MKKLSLFLFVVFCTLFGSLTIATNYSQEFKDAYNFAYENKLTTQSSIDKADMNGGLTRIAMAKMLSQYAINILGKSPDTSKVANFSDVSIKLDEDYNNGATLAYQLGIMGVGINKFRPYDKVTRAEFGTALSRLLFGDKYNQEGKNYYSKHLNALKNAGIMTKIDNPSQKEIRGYVMLMLMRSSSQNTDSNSGLHDEIQQNENYSNIENDYGSFEIIGLYKGRNSNSSISVGSLNGDSINVMNPGKQGLKLVFKMLGNATKEQIEYIGFIFKSGSCTSDGRCSEEEYTSIYSGEKINNGELVVNFTKERARSYLIEWFVQYNNVESSGATFGLELIKEQKGESIKNIKNNGYTGNIYDLPIYSSRQIIIKSNGSDDIDFVSRGMYRFRHIKDEYHNIGEFTIEHGKGKEDAYLREVSFKYSGNIDLNQAIDDIKLCNGHTRMNGTDCKSIPVTYTIKDKNIINIKLKDKINASCFSIFAKFKDLMYVGNNRISLSVNGPENFKIEMEDGSVPFYNHFSFNGLYTKIKGRNKHEYEKEFGELPDISNGSDESYSQTSSASDDSNSSSNGTSDNNSSEYSDNETTQPDDSSTDNTTQNDENDNNESSSENNNSEDSEECAYIKVDNGTSYCFNIKKVSGSKFGMSINNGDSGGAYGCSITREEGTNIGVFNSCSYAEFTILPSSGVHNFRIKLSYDGKQYSRKVSYDLTNGVFVVN